MEYQNKLALIIAYYLSKYDEKAYMSMGDANKTQTHLRVGHILGVKASTIKNMRDEFDSIHDNTRSGWHQRPLRPSRSIIIENFSDYNEEDLFEVVNHIMKIKNYKYFEKIKRVINLIS